MGIMEKILLVLFAVFALAFVMPSGLKTVAWTDFIFSVCGEELGLIGATIIMLLFAALILRGFWIALHARDRFGSLMVVGIMTLVGLQTFLNIGVVTGLLPTTGISLPFFSYGGTALTIQLAEMGVVLAGLSTKVLPQTMHRGAIQPTGIMAGKLQGAMPANTPRGSR